jgi:uncharacterized membrane protein
MAPQNNRETVDNYWRAVNARDWDSLAKLLDPDYVWVGAIMTHVRRHEAKLIAVPLVLLALAISVAWGRFGPVPFS